MRLADYVFEHLKSLGIDAVFMVSGGGAMYLCDAVGTSGLKFVPNHNEQASSISAEAYARVNEFLGVALVTTGPGSTNAITGVAGAWIESVPLLVISGQVKRADMKGETGVRQMGPQEVDIISMVSSITKFAKTVMDPADIKHDLKRAIHEATTGRRGPVWLDIPLDVQAADIDPDSLQDFTPPGEQTAAADIPFDQILAELVRAERPIILAGHGIRLAQAAESFRRLVEQLHIPVVSTWNSMDLIPATHPLMVGKPGVVALRAPNMAVQSADLLISIGARLDNVVTAFNPAHFGRNARKIVVDIDNNELGKFNHDIELKVQADAKVFIEGLIAKSEGINTPDRSEWLARCKALKVKYPIADGQHLPEKGEISHFLMVKAMSEEFPEHSLIVTGSSGLAVEFFYTGFEAKPGQRVFLTSGLGAMGYGLPAMLGAGTALGGDTPFIGVESDGSLMMNLQELFTIRAQNLPVRIFVMNNKGYASIRATQRNYFDSRFVGTNEGSKLWLPDIADLAKAAKIDYLSVSDGANLRSRIRETLAHPGPVICDIKLREDEALWPKSAAMPQKDGGMVSMPLEDMSPLLPLEELREAVIGDLDPASLHVAGR